MIGNNDFVSLGPNAAVGISGTGESIAASGDAIYGADGDGLVITGSNDTITDGQTSTTSLNGNDDDLSYVGANSMIGIGGTGDAVALSSSGDTIEDNANTNAGSVTVTLAAGNVALNDSAGAGLVVADASGVTGGSVAIDAGVAGFTDDAVGGLTVYNGTGETNGTVTLAANNLSLYDTIAPDRGTVMMNGIFRRTPSRLRRRGIKVINSRCPARKHSPAVKNPIGALPSVRYMFA